MTETQYEVPSFTQREFWEQDQSVEFPSVASVTWPLRDGEFKKMAILEGVFIPSCGRKPAMFSLGYTTVLRKWRLKKAQEKVLGARSAAVVQKVAKYKRVVEGRENP